MAGLQQHSRCFAYNESTVRVKSRSGHAAASELRLGLRCLLTGLLLLCGALNALEPGHSITQYAHKGWTRQEGQLKGSVFALTQTSDGNLWLGTEFGLVRFDGCRFVPWRPPQDNNLGSKHIYSVAAGRDGSLWIGTDKGLSHWTRGSLRNYPTAKSSDGSVVAAILVDRSGVVWVGMAGYGSGGLCRVEGNSLRCDGASNGPPGLVQSLLEDHSGNLWAGGAGGLRRWRPGVPSVYPLHTRAEMIYG